MSGELRRGFKAVAERIAASTRIELGLTIHDRLECTVLAAHFGIPTISLRELSRDGASAQSIRGLIDARARFSALTVSMGMRRLIVYNPDEQPGRRANSLAHELSHVILEHPPAAAFGQGGCRYWDAQSEAEADWLAGALLVPREGAVARLKAGDTLSAGARHFGVSLALFRWRINQTGIVRQLEATARRQQINKEQGGTTLQGFDVT